MAAKELAAMLNAKRIGKGKWLALCPAHPDRTPSLRIAEGSRFPVVLCCMSQGCSAESILQAMGIGWRDLGIEGCQVAPEVRQRIADQERLNKLEYRHGWIIMGKILNPDKPWYWLSAESEIEQDIYRLRGKLGAVR